MKDHHKNILKYFETFSCWIQATISFYWCKILLKPQNVIVECKIKNIKWKIIIKIFWNIENLPIIVVCLFAILNLFKDIKSCYFVIVHMSFNPVMCGVFDSNFSFHRATTPEKNKASDSTVTIFEVILGLIKIRPYISHFRDQI